MNAGWLLDFITWCSLDREGSLYNEVHKNKALGKKNRLETFQQVHVIFKYKYPHDDLSHT